MKKPTRILVTGACGQMGHFVVRAVHAAPDLELVGAADPAGLDRDIGDLALGGSIGVPVLADVQAAIDASSPDAMVDFTHPDVVLDNLKVALNASVDCVVGTTGLGPDDLGVVAGLCASNGATCIIAPNFSLGANLMMRFAAEAAKYYEFAEIVERHHERKADAPSGTAIKTAEMMEAARGGPLQHVSTSTEKIAGARGGELGGIAIHSMRLPGYVANQEVVLGGTGETLILEHATTSRECFMPGVLLALRRLGEFEGLVYGLENLL